MAHLILCDICKQPCHNSEAIELEGWYGKKLTYKGNRRKDDCYVAVLLSDREGLRADICTHCMQSQFANVTLHAVLTQKQMYEQRRRDYPHESGLKSLRLTAGYSVESVTCDNCQSNCYEKHLRFKANWLADDGSELTAEFCEPCTEAKLKPIVSFQAVAPAPVEATAAAL